MSSEATSVVLRRARIVSGVERGRVALAILEGPLEGEVHPGVVYSELGIIPEAGAPVLANTAGIEMGLGTGGVAFVLPGAGGEPPANEDHFVKLPYTPLQFPADQATQARSLQGVPVVALPLHSHLAPAACAARDLRPGSRVAFVWQEGGALPVGFSRVCRDLRGRGLLRAVVSCGNCFGGDFEAANVYAGMLAAAEVADVVLVGIGPGIVGTATPYGHGGMSVAAAVNAAIALGGYPVVAPRISRADGRERHRGVSHHTLAALSAILSRCRVAMPPDAPEVDSEALSRHDFKPLGYGARGLEERFGVTFSSMGRLYNEDRVFFDAAAAAVALSLGVDG